MSATAGETKIIFGDPRQPKALPLTSSKARYTEEFGEKTQILPKGWKKRNGCLSLPCDIRWDRDVPVKLRDGVTIYLDVYRPAAAAPKCPTLIAWSPYGKQGGAGNSILSEYPFRMGVAQSKLSELQKFEGPDPAYWCNHGYAVINPDSRGTCKSEGDIYQWGSQEGKDGADVIDWIGEQDWSNGKVGTTGNSWLAIASWFIAAERPKHLAAMAPWEGLADMFGDSTMKGGVASQPAMNFQLEILSTGFGQNSWENPVATIQANPNNQAYYNDKRAQIEKIQVPAYVVASWTNPVHAYGTLSAYSRLQGEKWLRIHDCWEWYDYYEDESVEDLRRFFDYYLKEIKNEWASTPRVRAKILDTSNPWPKTGTDFTTTTYPPPEATTLTLYLEGNAKTLSASIPKGRFQAEIKAASDEILFSHTFSKETVVCGLPMISLSISLVDGHDADIYVNLEKILANGSACTQLVVPFEKTYQSWLIRAAHRLGLVKETHAIMYQGPRGQVRVSRRLDNSNQSYLSGGQTWRPDTYRPVTEGNVVWLEPRLTPMGMRFKAGEKLGVRVGGFDRAVYPSVPGATLAVQETSQMTKTVNEKVKFVIHCGSEDQVDRASCIMLPII